jgi:hypothetical protein
VARLGLVDVTVAVVVVLLEEARGAVGQVECVGRGGGLARCEGEV